MLALAERAAGLVRAFLNQRDDLVLVIVAADTDMPAVGKTVDGVDQELGHAWSWVFADDFDCGADVYAGRIVDQIATMHAAVDAKLRAGGDAGWPALPPSLFDHGRAPAERLRVAAGVLRALAPKQPNTVTVFGLLPGHVADPGAWAGLCSAVTAHEFPLPWCARIRFLVRDDRARPALTSLAGPRIRRETIDFGEQAVATALHAEANDASLPPERRAHATLIAAGMDQAHGRWPEAEHGYTAVLAHAGPAGNASLAATAAGGIAACRDRRGDVEGAERILLAAVAACVASTPAPFGVMLNLFQSLVMLVARQQRWMEAEAHLTAVAWLSDVMVMPHSQVEALDRRGMAQLRQGRTAPAERSWRLAIAEADRAGEHDAGQGVRHRLAALLRRQERDAEAAEVLRAAA